MLKRIIFYPSGATLEYEQKVNFVNGNTTVQLDLPFAERIDCVLAKNGRMNGVTKATVMSESQDAQYLSLKTRLEQVKRELSELNKKLRSVDIRISLFNSNNRFNGENGFIKSEFEKNYEYFFSSLNALYGQRDESIAQSEKLENDKKRLEEEIGRFTPSVNRFTIYFEDCVKGEENVTLMLYTSNAGYNLRYKAIAELDKVELQLKAQVFNSSGINIENAAAVFCTAQNIYSELPTFSPQLIGGRNVMMRSFAAAPAFEEDADFSLVETEQSLVSRDFNVESISLNSGENKEITVKSYICECSVVCKTLPYAAERVHAVAQIDEDGLFSAPADVFYRGAKVGETYISDSAGQGINLSLGVDRDIIVRRETKPSFTSSLLNSKTEYCYEILLKNNRSDSVEVEVTDRVPVSQNKSVTVDVKNLSGGVLGEAGKVVFNIKLKKGESKALRVEYSVTQPKK